MRAFREEGTVLGGAENETETRVIPLVIAALKHDALSYLEINFECLSGAK